MTNSFNRIASFVIASQLDPNSNTDLETAAEIVASSIDGNTLIYSNSPRGTIGFVDITDPSAPVGLGEIEVGGEPTSVTVKDNYALVAVNTSPDFINPSGQLVAVNITTQELLGTTWDLGGQPDSIAVSPDGNYAVIAIENERDEDLGDGAPPQLPEGFVVIVDTSDADPNNWTTSQVTLTGLAGVAFPEDPEPEFVDISENNIAAVTLQENNAIVLIDLATGTVINSFSAGTVDLTGIDTEEEDPAIIDQTSSLTAVPREPDGITFIGTDYIATADEGDLDGGSRGFTIFDLDGNVVFTSGNTMDQLTAQFGHYPDARSENKGNEPENIEFATYNGSDYLFVNSERSSLVFVYNVDDPTNPVFEQVLPAGVAPEGGKAIPERDLLVVASEEDDRDAKIRSVLNIYEYDADGTPAYPTLQSEPGNPPIPWSAISGLAAGAGDILYAVEDSFYASNRFFTIDTSTTPATLTDATTIKDTNDVFAALRPDLVNADTDKTINIDPEGIAATGDGFLWIASEGAGAAGDDDQILNYLFKVDATTGTIAEVITLPDEVNANQIRFGLEGVAYDDGQLTVILQRAWTGDSNPRVLVYDTATSEWVGDYFYPLDAVESQNGGWVGLSDISPLGNGNFLVLERDNQGGPDAAIKRLYSINLSGVENGTTLEKNFVRDLIPDFTAGGGLMPEKLEGLAVTKDKIWVINDNDGVDDNSGETQLIALDFSAKIGETTALIPQAGSSTDPEDLLDGESGDTDFPYGTFKALATVGEIDPNTGHVLTGYPDGQAAWLLDEDTIRVAYQSESYATISNETYPWFMDSGVSFTGSHIHTIDYNRAAFADFLNNDSAASEMFERAGHLFNTVYNAFGEMVDGKNADPADLSAKWGNQTGADGTLYEFLPEFQLTQAEWFFHSFCGAYYEDANKYGDGIGFEDDVWLMGEEWNIGRMFEGGDDFFTNNTMGLASMVVDIANEIAYTVPVLGQAGYEKILPINPGNEDYVVLAMSGYNLEVEPAPLKIYIGKKDFDASGNAIDYNTASERDAFLARNGLLFGQLYGMAATAETYAALGIETVDADTEMLNAYATDADAPDNFAVRYYATDYRWDGFDTPENAGETEVYRWLQDGDDGEANEQPDGYTFFNGDSKVEHPAVDPDITKSRYVINLTDARSIFGIDFSNIINDLANDADGNGLPDYLSADVTRIVAGVDGALTLETNGKGAAHVGDNNPDGTLTHATHVEDQKAYADQPDGLQWVKAADGDYLIVDEDSGNDYGERKYVLPIDADTLALSDPGTGYFLASAGGSLNPRAQEGVAAIPGTFSRATSSEFSGTWNVSHLVATKEDGSFYTQAELAGTGAQDIIGGLPLAEQTFIGVVQHAGESGGVVADRLADQGGQIFMFNITEPLTPPPFTLELFHLADQEPLNAGAGLTDITGLSAVLNALKAQDLGNDGQEDNTLVLSSGDAIIPGLFYEASLPAFGSRGIADIQIQNELGIQAIAFGNHEFDFGTQAIADLISGAAEGEILGADFAGANFPYLSTNLDFAADANFAPLEVEGGQAPQANTVTSSTVIDVNGEQIGVVGATTPTLGSISSPGDLGISPSPFGSNPTEAELDALAAIIQAEVDALLAANPGMNKVVLLAHMQKLTIEEALATRLENVDIIVGGGSNTRLFDETDRVRPGDSNQGEYPKFITNAGGTQTALVNTDGSYKYLGRLVIDFDADGNIIPESYDANISGAYATDAQGVADLNATGLVDPEIQQIVDAIEAEIVATESNVFGLASVFLNGNRSGQPTDGVRTQETNLGNLTADANLALAQSIDPTVVVSIKNGGGIRASIGETIVPPGGTDAVRSPNSELLDSDGNVVKPEGGISENDIKTTLNFNNGLSLLTVTKSELVALLEHGVAGLPSAAGQFPQIAGVKFSFDPDLAVGDRLLSAGIFDDNDQLVAELLRDGEIVGDANQTFRIVTLNFLADGGDSYPFPTGESANRVDLYDLNGDGTADESLTGDATFAFDGTEQDALAEYLDDNFATTPFAEDDVDPTGDMRIQNLNFREDNVFDDDGGNNDGANINFTPAEPDSNLGSLTYDSGNTSEVSVEQQALNQTDALFDNLIGLYRLENADGAVLDINDANGNGSTNDLLNPDDRGYAAAALSQFEADVLLRLGSEGDIAKNTSADQFGDVLINGGQYYAPFIIANGGSLLAPGETLADGIAKFLDTNRSNAGATIDNFPTHEVAYFSFGAANPDGTEHLQSRGNNIFGFEDLPGNLGISDFDFNDAVFEFIFA